MSVAALAARALLDGAALEEGLDAVRVVDGWAFSEAWLDETARRGRGAAPRSGPRRSPLDPGVALAELLPAEPWAPVIVLGLLPVERRGPKRVPPGCGCEPRGACRRGGVRSSAELVARRARPRRRSTTGELARFLESEGRLVRLGDGFAVSAGAYEVARDLVVDRVRRRPGEITLARFRDLAGVGRRDAQLLLERMDVDGVTRRVGDRRVLRRAARTGG